MKILTDIMIPSWIDVPAVANLHQLLLTLFPGSKISTHNTFGSLKCVRTSCYTCTKEVVLAVFLTFLFIFLKEEFFKHSKQNS
jgi:hypothetical protein